MMMVPVVIGATSHQESSHNPHCLNARHAHTYSQGGLLFAWLSCFARRMAQLCLGRSHLNIASREGQNNVAQP